jgi:hypothetical protein
MRRRATTGLSIAAAFCFLSACGDSSPTGASAFPGSGVNVTSTNPAPSGASMGLSGPAYAAEEFTCVNVETVRVRFTAPGYVEDDRVGLYVFFEGIPEGPKRLRIWWDIENEPGVYRDFTFPEVAVALEDVYEHRYGNLRGATEMLVRVELILDELTGNCPRNRRVAVAPQASSGGSPPSPAPPATQTANVGPGIGAINNVDFNFFEGVRFTASTPLTIDSVWVSPNGPGTLVVNLWDDTGSTLFDTTSVAVAGGAQPVSLGFAVPQPGNYILSLDGTAVGAAGVGMTFPRASYPYQIPGVISLTDTAFYLGTFGFYYYLYDWQVTW